MDSLKELHFSFLECELAIRWMDRWLEKATIHLEGQVIGRLKGAFFDPKQKQYKVWVCSIESNDSTIRVEGNLKACVSLAVGHWMTQKGQVIHFFETEGN